MKLLCWLFGHAFSMSVIGGHHYRLCARCGHTSVMIERHTFGVVMGETWERVPESK